MHLRMPSIDQGVQSFIWAVVFFVILWLGMLAVGVSSATALIVSLVSAAAIFLFVRLRGEDRPGPGLEGVPGTQAPQAGGMPRAALQSSGTSRGRHPLGGCVGVRRMRPRC